MYKALIMGLITQILSPSLLLLQPRLDFREPLMVSLEFGLADEDKGPVLDENLPRSINETVRLHITCKSLSQHFKCELPNNSTQKESQEGSVKQPPSVPRALRTRSAGRSCLAPNGLLFHHISICNS